MTHKQLEYFLKTATLLNMTKAAKALYISQPALSEQIRRLEQELGVDLFLRKDKSLKLTPAGKVLIGETYELFAKEQELIDAVRSAGTSARQQLNIRYLTGVLPKRIPQMINRFHQAYPDILLQISIGNWNELNEDIQNGNYDVAFQLRIGETTEESQHRADLMTATSYLAAAEGHPLTHLKEITYEDVQSELFSVDILSGKGSSHAASLYGVFARHGTHQPHVLRASNIQDTLLNIRSGLAVGIMATDLIEDDTSGLCFLPWSELKDCTLCLHDNPKRDSEAIRAFVEFVKQEFISNTLSSDTI